MADEELDAGLVERAGRAAWQESADGELTDETWNDWRYRRLRAAYCNEARAVLRSLGIPAAALNALARGEATVVPKRITREICDARQDVHGFSPLDEEAWVRVQHGGERQSEWAAMLAASPYAAKE